MLRNVERRCCQRFWLSFFSSAKILTRARERARLREREGGVSGAASVCANSQCGGAALKEQRASALLPESNLGRFWQRQINCTPPACLSPALHLYMLCTFLPSAHALQKNTAETAGGGEGIKRKMRRSPPTPFYKHLCAGEMNFPSHFLQGPFINLNRLHATIFNSSSVVSF